MTETELRPFTKLYFNSRYMGAADLLRRFFGLTSDEVVPLSVAHGVDFGHCHDPMDVGSVEPIHWSCNTYMHTCSSKFKHSILLPHPWVMHCQNLPVPKGKGVLVIGPPPSPANDFALYKIIRKDIRSDWSILVKARGAFQGSMDYWAKCGLKPLTASGPDCNFYNRLFNLLSQYETIVGCTFSSALVFAAAIGKRIELVQGYKYQVYEPAAYEAEVDLSSSRARSVVAKFLQGDQITIHEVSRELLGYELGRDKLKTVKKFQEAKAILKLPFWDNPQLEIPYALRELLAMRLNKPKIMTSSLHSYLQHFKRTNICIMNINEFDVWSNCKTIENFALKPVKYIPGITEPGIAPMGYMK